MSKTKKKKFTFIDLADENFGIIEKDNYASVDESETNDKKVNSTLENSRNENINGENKQEIFQPKEILIEERVNIGTAIDEVENREDVKEVTKKNKKVFEVNYDDILKDNNQNTSKVVSNFFEKKDPIKDLFKSEISPQDNLESEESNKSYKNLKPRSTLKTYNEAVKIQENNKNNGHFQEEKIREFLNVREKLEVKTNIYLKSSIVIKLKELEERTNESRSSIINKLIEIALKNIEE